MPKVSAAASSHAAPSEEFSIETFLDGLNIIETISLSLPINPQIAKALLEHFTHGQTQRLYYTFYYTM